MLDFFPILFQILVVAFMITTLLSVLFWIIMGYHFHKFSPSWSFYQYTVPLVFLLGLGLLVGIGVYAISLF
ncbi:MAG: hypothetical protein Q8P70_02550 [bacterium]|nr:hypothetical protein [bacterium]